MHTDFSITTALMLKVSSINAGLNSSGGRFTCPCLKCSQGKAVTPFCEEVHSIFLRIYKHNNLLALLPFLSLAVSESTMSALRQSKVPENERCSPKYIR